MVVSFYVVGTLCFQTWKLYKLARISSGPRVITTTDNWEKLGHLRVGAVAVSPAVSKLVDLISVLPIVVTPGNELCDRHNSS